MCGLKSIYIISTVGGVVNALHLKCSSHWEHQFESDTVRIFFSFFFKLIIYFKNFINGRKCNYTNITLKKNRIKGNKYLYNNEIKLWNGKTLMTICEHNKRKYDCKLCNGSNRCSHGKIKISCKICSPDTFCEHNKRKTVCKICKGNSLCDHNTLKYLCKICKGGSICIHNKRKNECRLCDGSCFCNHNKKKSECRICSPDNHTLCIHCKYIWGSKRYISSKNTYEKLCADCYYHLYPDEKKIPTKYKKKQHYIHEKLK